MSNNMRLLLSFIVFSFLISTNQIKAQSDSISSKQFKLELALIQKLLEKQHTNLYLFCSEEMQDSLIKSMYKEVTGKISTKEAYQRYGYFLSHIQDGHLFVTPSANDISGFFTDAPVFPFELFSDGNQLNIIKDYSRKKTIPIGSQIVSVNGNTVDSMRQFITSSISKDGPNMQYPNFVFYHFFRESYGFFYDFPNTFQIEYLNEDQQIVSDTVSATTNTIIDLKKELDQINGISEKGIYLDIDKETKVAKLRVGSFYNADLRRNFKQNFKREIRRAFKTINENDIEKLVIDIRDNLGGEVNNGTYLLRHITNEKINSMYAMYDMQYDELTDSRIVESVSHISSYERKPMKNNFTGKIFMLTNGGSFSCASMVANTVKTKNIGTIVGEMTGGSSSVNSGSPNEEVILPYSKVFLTIPQTRFQLNPSLKANAKGVEPDIEVKDNYERLLGKEDPLMKAVLEINN